MAKIMIMGLMKGGRPAIAHIDAELVWIRMGPEDRIPDKDELPHELLQLNIVDGKQRAMFAYHKPYPVKNDEKEAEK